MSSSVQPANVPASLEDVTLIDAPTAAKTAGVSVSTWHNLVRERKAPQGARFGTRCTRWKAGEVYASGKPILTTGNDTFRASRSQVASDEEATRQFGWLDA